MMNDAVTRGEARIRPAGRASSGRAVLAGEAGLACVLALLVTAGHALAGFPFVWNVGSDNDSFMRIVEVRDLLGGQNWFDLRQVRMGLEGGFTMHWSRLVDAPLALLFLLGERLTGSAANAAAFAQVVWPTLMFAAALFLILRLARVLGGLQTRLPALVVGVSALYGVQVFRPGMIDHHNFQFVVLLGATLALLAARERPLWGAVAGAACALMLGIGMETAPHVAALCLFAGADFLFRGEKAAAGAAAFGLGLGFAGAAIMAGTVPWGSWNVVACDAFSLPQATLALTGGLGLALAATIPGRDRMAVRAAALVLLGAACAALLLWRFPECLADPYAGLDERLKRFWLGAVGEAQPAWRVAAQTPAAAAAAYVTPFIALVVLGHGLLREGVSRARLLVFLLLGVSFAVSLWQVRGMYIALPLAAVALAGFVARVRLGGRPLAMALAWIVSIDAAWAGAAALAFRPSIAATSAAGSVAAGTGNCEAMADYASLARQPPTRVLAVSNLGAAILAWTPHSVLAGPYHRNIEGNLAGLDAWMAEPDDARRMLEAEGAGLVAWCAGNSEADVMAAAPEGLAASLRDGRAPAWLEPVQETRQSPLKLFRIIPAR